VRERLARLPQWEAQALEEALRELAEERGVAAGKVFQPLRLALTGASVSPGIFDVLLAAGRDLTLGRLDQAVEFLRE
jgi:glutamyl-tRNA synthetase